MKPLYPKYKDTIKLELRISEQTNEILKQYSKYTKFDVDEIVNHITSEIIQDDQDFVKWLRSKRFSKKIKERIFGETSQDEILDTPTNEKCQVNENPESLQDQMN